MLLYETTSDGRAYEEVLHECERRIRIEAPSYLAPHSPCLPAPEHY
jgi:hypothetical protein